MVLLRRNDSFCENCEKCEVFCIPQQVHSYVESNPQIIEESVCVCAKERKRKREREREREERVIARDCESTVRELQLKS